MSKVQIYANDIVKLLRQRHAEDVFVSECKNGPSQVGSHLRLDGWAMKKSWASPLVIGYEVKVSRSDFLRYDKWRGYLPMCNCLYFVTAPGVAQESEIPEECGLIVTSTNGARLLTKKKAPYREVLIPESVFRYIIMCRARIGGEMDFENLQASRRAFWESWLKEKQWNREIGYQVRRELARVVEKAVKEAEELRAEYDGYEAARKALRDLGISGYEAASGYVESCIRRKVDALNELLPEDFLGQVKELAATAQGVAAKLEGAKQ